MPSPVISLTQAQAGDLVACTSADVVGRMIRVAEWLKPSWRAGSDVNHYAWLDHQTVDGEWIVGQAEAHGVTCNARLSTVAPGGSYVIQQLPAECDRARVLEFLRGEVGSHYGFLTIASIAVTIAAPKFVNVMVPGTWVCSALIAEGLRAGGWLHRWGDIYQVSPAQLDLAVGS
jgi:hypothetical protein